MLIARSNTSRRLLIEHGADVNAKKPGAGRPH
jgi:hypothetical protein